MNEASRSMTAKLSDLTDRLDAVEERFAIGKIEDALYEKTSVKLRHEIKEISDELSKLDLDISNPKELLYKWADFAANLGNLWVSEDVSDKKILQDILFPEGIFSDQKIDGFRTSSANKVLELITEISTHYEEKKSDKMKVISLCRLQ